MDTGNTQDPFGAPPVVPVSGDGGALAQFLPESSADKDESSADKEMSSAKAPIAGTDAAALGQFLRGARERRGLTVQQISDVTKIPCRRLEALEQGNLAAIPGGFYGRAEVRAYAETVHVDPNVALARLERALEAPAARDASRETQPAEEPARTTGKPLAATAVLAAAVLVWFAVWSPSTSAPERDVRAGSVMQTQQPEELNVRTGSVAQAQQPEDLNVRTSSVTQIQELGGPAPAAEVAANASAGTSGQVPTAQAATPSPIAQAAAPLPVDRATTSSPDSEVDLGAQSDSEGELIVTTEPAGGRVTVDGVGWGITPVTIRNLPLGAKRIRVTKDGYGAEERVVRLVPNRSTVTLQIPLRPAPKP